MNVSVRTIDKRGDYDKLVAQAKRLHGSYTKVGYPEDAKKLGAASKTGSGHAPYPDMEEVAFVASIHEFGAPGAGIPARPFLRPAFDENRDKIQRVQERALKMVLDSRLTVRQGLGLIGEAGVALVKRQIRKVKEPPLQPATIARKGSSQPLIDTGQMLNSTTHVEVVK